MTFLDRIADELHENLQRIEPYCAGADVAHFRQRIMQEVINAPARDTRAGCREALARATSISLAMARSPRLPDPRT